MGAMADLGVHKTDLIQYLIGQTVDEVEAQLCTLDKKFSDGSPITVDDNAFCIYHMDGGAVGTMTASWTNYGPEDNSTVINGTKGVLRIYDDPEPYAHFGKEGRFPRLLRCGRHPDQRQPDQIRRHRPVCGMPEEPCRAGHRRAERVDGDARGFCGD